MVVIGGIGSMRTTAAGALIGGEGVEHENNSCRRLFASMGQRTVCKYGGVDIGCDWRERDHEKCSGRLHAGGGAPSANKVT